MLDMREPMLDRSFLRRAGAAFAVALAAAASIATSAPRWELEDSLGGLHTRLDSSQSEEARHFTVTSSQAHSLVINAKLSWDMDEQSPAAAVRVTIQRDDGEEPRELIDRVESHMGPDGLSPGELNISDHPDCAAAPCEMGYTVTFTMVDGHPSEHVDIDWSALARISGEDTREPDDAMVDIVED
jgi:hypothetical protein